MVPNCYNHHGQVNSVRQEEKLDDENVEGVAVPCSVFTDNLPSYTTEEMVSGQRPGEDDLNYPNHQNYFPRQAFPAGREREYWEGPVIQI